MSDFFYDPDEWETIVTTHNYGTLHGVVFGSVSCSQIRRSLEEILKIKAERQRKHEDAVLREADEIRRRRELAGD